MILEVPKHVESLIEELIKEDWRGSTLNMLSKYYLVISDCLKLGRKRWNSTGLIIQKTTKS